MCVHMCECKCKYMHTCVCTQRGQRATSSVIPWVPSSCFYDRVSHRIETYQAVRLTGQRAPGICPSCSRTASRCHHAQLFLSWFWGLDMGPHACKASTFLTEPPLSLKCFGSLCTSLSLWKQRYVHSEPIYRELSRGHQLLMPPGDRWLNVRGKV